MNTSTLIKPSNKDIKSCKRKRSFFTQREANVTGKRFNQRSYKCPVCHCWHLTKQDFNKEN